MSGDIPLESIETPDGVSCFNCEACCCRLLVMLDDEDLVRGVPCDLIDEDEWGGAVMRQDEEGWCAAVDRNTMLCTIYSRRPQSCRDFTTDSVECLEERALYGLPAHL
ncbi:YkgJ family cysteine cluster protein [Kushneria aurantia]|uniref:YkgJ family cysteine cluster protein n=1 Tax=Kushneria aurantia TaxID=504092 RepID=A0ABV6G3J8_9GAMM|nr:YkgJ family cysteine cluster protein [Kushneria aurantia]